MENWQKRHIKSKIDKLVECTRFDTLLCADLESKGLLSKSDQQLLEITKRNCGELAQRNEFYNILATKTDSYDLLIQCLENAEQSGAVAELRETPSPVMFNVNNPSSKFFGRTNELQSLYDHIMRGQLQDHKRFYSNLTCIVGMGGIGKTELTRKFCQKYLKSLQNFNNIIWINGETDMSIASSFTELAIELNISTKNASGQDRYIISIANDIIFCLPNYPLTIIYDNVNKLEVLLERKYLELKSFESLKFRPNILVTSRATTWEKSLGENCIFNLDLMFSKEAISWVESRLQNIDEDNNSYTKLVEVLDCYPLALQQVISYIEHRNDTSNYTVNKYLLDFQERKGKLKIMSSEYFNCEYGSEYKYTTLTTFLTSIECIFEDENGFLAMKYLSMCAYLNPDNISESLFSIQDMSTDEHEKALNLLTKFSLLRTNMTKQYTIHRVLQEVLRCYLQMRETEPYYAALEEKIKKLQTSEMGFLTEFGVLDNILSNIPMKDETQHAAYLWTHVPNYKKLVKRYFKSVIYGSYFWTPLHILCDAGSIQPLNCLLQSLKSCFSSKVFRTFINQTDDLSRTSLFLAAASGHARVIEMLHQNNADLTVESSICYDSFEKLQHPACINSKFTAIHIATYNRHKHAVCMLNSLNSDLANISDSQSNTPIYIAIKLADKDLVKSFKTHSVTDEIGVIITQIGKGILDLDNLKEFLSQQNQSLLKEYLETKLSGGRWSLLNLAISAHVSTNVLDFLVSKGAIATNYQLECGIIDAARNNDLDTFKWTYKQSTELTGFVFSNYVCNSVYEAARFGALDIIKFIVPGTRGNNSIPELEIDIDAQDINGNTALYKAAFRGEMNVVEYLIKHGADVNIYNKWGSTPIIAAALAAKFDVVKYLVQLPETIIEPTSYEKDKRTLLGMFNLTFLHVCVAYDIVNETELFLNIVKERDESLFLKFMSANWSFNNNEEVISLAHIAVFFDCPKVLEHFVQNYSEQMRLNSIVKSYHVTNVFHICCQNNNLNIPRRLEKIVSRFLKILRLIPKETVRLTPFGLARVMGNMRCMDILRNEGNEPEFSYISKKVLAMVMPKVKLYQLAAKQYMNANTGNNAILGNKFGSKSVSEMGFDIGMICSKVPYNI